MELDRLRDRAERFARLVAGEEYERERSPGAASRLGEVHRLHGALFELERISEVQRAVSESTGTEERRARLLLEFLVRGRGACSGWRELDERDTLLHARSISVGEERLPLRGVESAAGAADAEHRRLVEAAWLDALHEEEPVFQDLLARRAGVYEEIGYGRRVDSMEIVCGVDLRALARDAARFVADTDGVHRELLAWHLPRLAGVEAAEATALDLPALRPPPVVAREFSARPPLRTFRPLFARTGLDLDAGGRLRVETHASLGGGAAAACIPLGVPAPVALLETRASDAAAHAAVLRALGAALHCAHTDPELPLELRWLGDRAVWEASGLLFEGLLGQRAFLRDAYRLRPERAEEWRRLAALLLLLRLRRDAALLRAAVEWAEEEAPDEAIRDRGSELLTAATGARHHPAATFALLDLPAERARPLRAAQLAALLADSLRERHDEDWYRNPATGEGLRAVFADGLRYNAAERGVQIASAPLSFEPVERQIAELLA